jgi:ABC-2 type transport system permease protein
MSPALTPRRIWFRTVFWLVRRELWEHRAIYIAPAAVALFASLAHLASSLSTADGRRDATLAGAAGSVPFSVHYQASIGVLVIVSLLVGLLYCLDALNGERRDRSVLFWKSMPVTDWQTVLSKLAVPALVMPVIIFVLAILMNLLMLALQSLAWTMTGYDARDLWARLDLPGLWAALAAGLVFMSFWYAPLWTWLLLVSGWARRAVVLWALAPFAAFLIVEHLVLAHSHIHWALERWLAGGILQPYTTGGDGRDWIDGVASVRPLHLLSLPMLWIGLAAAALFLLLAVRIRRSRVPD